MRLAAYTKTIKRLRKLDFTPGRFCLIDHLQARVEVEKRKNAFVEALRHYGGE